MKSFVILLVALLGFQANAQNKSKSVQEVNFDGSQVDGKVRNPNGSYVVQKRGVDFVPLYKVKEHFDKSIKESVEYLR
ncbi:MAG: hypothetical protein KDD25_07100 [Bdellovibrionales bacterium]|nr:hypothetical protein [Bdellovibrionales bacterium]